MAVVENPASSGGEKRYLSIEGRIHSKVVAVGQNIFPPSQGPVWQWLSLVYTRIAPIYHTGESRMEALWRTTVTNRASNMQVADSSLFVNAMSSEAVQWIEAGLKEPGKRFALGATLMLNFAALVYRAMSGRHFFVTNNGYMGPAPADVSEGDDVCLLFGVEVPMILRDCGNGEREIIGPCYCHGIMEGEGMVGEPEGERFVLR